jgi:hypothetical protein
MSALIIDKKQEKRYKKCCSGNLNYEEFEHGDGGVYQKCWCSVCDTEYNEVYVESHVETRDGDIVKLF